MKWTIVFYSIIGVFGLLVVAGVMMLFDITPFDRLQLTETELGVVRNVIFSLGGVGAAIGLRFTYQRLVQFSHQTDTMIKQADAAQRQAEISHEQLFNHKLQLARALMSDDRTSKRSAGVTILSDLARDSEPETKKQLALELYYFLLDQGRVELERDGVTIKRKHQRHSQVDISLAIHKLLPLAEQCGLDMKSEYPLRGVYFSHVILKCDFVNVRFVDVVFDGCYFQTLDGCDFLRCSFVDSHFSRSGGRVNNCGFYFADFNRCHILIRWSDVRICDCNLVGVRVYTPAPMGEVVIDNSVLKKCAFNPLAKMVLKFEGSMLHNNKDCFDGRYNLAGKSVAIGCDFTGTRLVGFNVNSLDIRSCMFRIVTEEGNVDGVSYRSGLLVNKEGEKETSGRQFANIREFINENIKEMIFDENQARLVKEYFGLQPCKVYKLDSNFSVSSNKAFLAYRFMPCDHPWSERLLSEWFDKEVRKYEEFSKSDPETGFRKEVTAEYNKTFNW